MDTQKIDKVTMVNTLNSYVDKLTRELLKDDNNINWFEVKKIGNHISGIAHKLCFVGEKKMTESEQILYDYREALRKLYGDTKADASNLYYHKGWYYIAVATKCPDGTYYTPGIADGRRKKEIVEMTHTLLSRF